MSPLRPDLVDVWIFRVTGAGPEFLLLRRSGEKVLAGLWQGVSGKIEGDETPGAGPLGEAWEETGIGRDRIERLYSLDFVASFLWGDEVWSSVHLALLVPPGVERVMSREHDALAWPSFDDAVGSSVWPGYREAITRVRDCLLDPARE